MAYAMCLPLTGLEPTPSTAVVFTAMLVLFPLLHAALLAWNDRAFRRFAGRVLGAPESDPRGGLRTVLIEGIATGLGTAAPEGPWTAIRRRVDFSMKQETTHSTDKHGQSVERTITIMRDREHTSAQAFAVQVAGIDLGVEVLPQGAHVALASRAWELHASATMYSETLAAGQPVCVVARFEEQEGTLRAPAMRGLEGLRRVCLELTTGGRLWLGPDLEFVRCDAPERAEPSPMVTPWHGGGNER
jgi:hypothetical protein